MTQLKVLWTTTDNKETVESMLLMYLINAIKNKWFDEINVVIWGASSRLVGKDIKIQNLIINMIEIGVTFEACKVCSDNYKSSDVMKTLDVDVKYVGVPLTKYIKSSDEFFSI
jgi:hypothetical protein